MGFAARADSLVVRVSPPWPSPWKIFGVCRPGQIRREEWSSPPWSTPTVICVFLTSRCTRKNKALEFAALAESVDRLIKVAAKFFFTLYHISHMLQLCHVAAGFPPAHDASGAAW